LAQSMARELGPQNIHVAHVVIDGAIDTEWIKANFPDRYNSGPDGILNPDHIAEVYWQLHKQPRSAWTFEMDIRPWKEGWWSPASRARRAPCGVGRCEARAGRRR